MKKHSILVGAFATVLAIFQIAEAQSQVPVMVGGDTDLDACASKGRVVNLDPNGDNFLSLRA